MTETNIRETKEKELYDRLTTLINQGKVLIHIRPEDYDKIMSELKTLSETYRRLTGQDYRYPIKQRF